MDTTVGAAVEKWETVTVLELVLGGARDELWAVLLEFSGTRAVLVRVRDEVP